MDATQTLLCLKRMTFNGYGRSRVRGFLWLHYGVGELGVCGLTPRTYTSGVSMEKTLFSSGWLLVEWCQNFTNDMMGRFVVDKGKLPGGISRG